MKRETAEVAAVILTGGIFLVFENVFHLKMAFLIPCALGWILYIIYRLAKKPSLRREWGLRTDNLRPAASTAGLVFVIAAVGILAYRAAAGWLPLPASSLIIFALYPIWGFLQQFMVQALVAGNLRRLGASPAIIVPAAAILFGLAHLPDWPLAGLCAAAGVAWTILFLRTPNLLPLAFSHAWLGTLTYYWVFERDPWLEMFRAA